MRVIESGKKISTLAVTATLLLAQLTFNQEVASAVTGTFNCGTSGTYTVIDGVLQGSSTCTGALVLDSSVTRINYATGFYSTSGITSISIPATTTTISYYAISPYKSVNLVEYVVDPNNPNYSSVDGVLYNKNRTVLIAYPYGKNELAFTVPSSVTQISGYAFNCLTYLQTVNVGANALDLDYAFSPNGCSASALRAVVVDSSNPNYSSSDGVFFNKNQTTLLMYPMGKSDTSYVVPNTVTTIRKAAYNPFLTSITLPTGLRTISGYAFESSKLTSIFIPDSVTSYSGNPFINSDSLASIDVGENNVNYKSIGGVIYSKNGQTLLDYPAGKTDTSFEIPSGVTTLDSQWNWYNKYLRRITVPSSVTSIGYGVNRNGSSSDTYLIFSGNSALTSIQGDYAKNITYCGNSNSPITNYATSKNITVRCQTQAPDFALSQDTLTGVKSTSFTGYTISASVPADYYSISPSLSSGLSFSTTTGLVSGSPTVAAAARTYTITGTNSIGSTSRSFNLTVEEAPAFTLSPSSLTKSVGASNSFYSISSTGGMISSYSISPEITNTPGLSFSTSTGLISGIPTQASTARTYTITATNAIGSATRTFSLTVTPASRTAPGAPTIGTATALSPTSASITFTAPASNGGATIETYTATSSPGSITGRVAQSGSGTITVSGLTSSRSYTFTVTASNSEGTSSASGATVSITMPASQSEIDAAALAAQKAAEAKREAEKQAARNEITNAVKTSQDVNLEMFTKAEISGVTAANIAAVQTEISALPQSSRADLSQVLKIARKYEVVGMVASDRVASIYSDSLIEIGLIPEQSKHKAALTAAIKELPVDKRSSYAEIKEAIDDEMAEIQARKDRLANVIARNASRYTK